VVKKCLAKEAEKRWQGASDLCDELKWIAEGGFAGYVGPSAPAKGIRTFGRRALLLSVGTLLLVAAVTGLAVWNLKPSPAPPPVSRAVFTLPSGQQLAGLEKWPAVALSSDGTHLAYCPPARAAPSSFMVRAMDSLEPSPSPPPREPSTLLSPDGQWVGFFRGRKAEEGSR